MNIDCCVILRPAWHVGVFADRRTRCVRLPKAREFLHFRSSCALLRCVNGSSYSDCTLVCRFGRHLRCVTRAESGSSHDEYRSFPSRERLLDVLTSVWECAGQWFDSRPLGWLRQDGPVWMSGFGPRPTHGMWDARWWISRTIPPRSFPGISTLSSPGDGEFHHFFIPRNLSDGKPFTVLPAGLAQMNISSHQP